MAYIDLDLIATGFAPGLASAVVGSFVLGLGAAVPLLVGYGIGHQIAWLVKGE